MEHTYYRIVRGSAVAEEDFKPAKELGKPLRDPSLERQWSEGVSVYDSFERAVAQTRRFRCKLGRFVVAVALPADATVKIEQTGDDPRHYTLYGDPRHLLSLATEPPRRVDKEER